MIASAGSVLSGAAPDPVETVQKSATEWVKTRTETVAVLAEWAGQKELMEATAVATTQRAQRAEEQRDNLKAKTARDREELTTLETKNRNTAEELKATELRLKELSKKILELRPSLPPRLSDALEMPYRSIADATLSATDRLQVTVSVLNRCIQFNRTITYGEEILTLEGEPGPKSLEVIYWGLSHGYALDQAAGKAWVGAPGATGWHWVPRAEAVRPVAQLIAIHTGHEDPAFTAVPVQLGRGASPAVATQAN